MAIKHHPDYPLIIAANRDEFLSRPASEARFWNDKPAILAGRDLQAGGTWLGITKYGRFAAVTNYHEQIPKPVPDKSRGDLVVNFLESALLPQEYANYVLNNGNEYQGFTLVYGTVDDLHYCSNRLNKSEQIKSGIHGLSNYLFNDSSYKVKKGKESLTKILTDPDKISHEDLFSLLQDRTLEWQRNITEDKSRISPIFIKGQDFGTRCSTVILVDNKGNVDFSERTFLTEGTPAKTVQYEFVYRS
jgi:uncharacterized protein with NRDE domain